ncbi:hypothetical protein BDV95DRAFT_269436 [Massariosphaeria phaeospora]|uniref:Uncharacterized protein n=1 Tax=Massariosphaeria phaeospora TaxID=100035 RepID=A0A7C8LZU2_9PLEO|nr:hypothetical protein BDV95DRAFT_269436 [Massariosphaeria phaeospora]
MIIPASRHTRWPRHRPSVVSVGCGPPPRRLCWTNPHLKRKSLRRPPPFAQLLLPISLLPHFTAERQLSFGFFRQVLAPWSISRRWPQNSNVLKGTVVLETAICASTAWHYLNPVKVTFAFPCPYCRTTRPREAISFSFGVDGERIDVERSLSGASTDHERMSQ